MKISMDLYLALTNFDIKQFPYLMPELYNVLKHSPRDRIVQDLQTGRIEVDERLSVLTTAMYLQNDDRIEYIFDYKNVIAELLKELNFDTYYASFMEVRNTALTFIDKDAEIPSYDRQIPAAYDLNSPITPVQKEIQKKAKAVFDQLPEIGTFSGITFVKVDTSTEDVNFKGVCPLSLYPNYKFDYTKTGLLLSEENIQILNLNLAAQISTPTKESLVEARSEYVREHSGVLSNAVNMIKGDFMDSLMAKTFVR